MDDKEEKRTTVVSDSILVYGGLDDGRFCDNGQKRSKDFRRKLYLIGKCGGSHSGQNFMKTCLPLWCWYPS